MLVLSPGGHDFGTIGLGSSSAFTYSVQNKGGRDSSAISFSLSGTGASQFKLETAGFSGECQNGITMLAPNDSCTIQVRFQPLSIGMHSATLQASATMGGTTTAGMMGNAVAGGTTLFGSPPMIDFGCVEPGQSSQVVDISTVADGNPSVQIEFELRTDGTVQLGGWNLDDVELTQIGPATTGCAPPTAYGPAKVHSGGSIARLAAVGETSLLFGPFQMRIEGGVPQRPAMVYSSSAPAATPMLGGTLLIAQPFAREIAWQFDLFGDASSIYTVQPSQVGTTRYFQCVFRDPASPDGTGMGFSKALRVSFCP